MAKTSSYFVWGALLLLIALTAWLTWDAAVPAVVLLRPDTRPIVQGESIPKTLVDAYGQKTILQKPPQRIVSAMLATDEILLDLISRERIAAVTSLSAMPTISNCSRKAKGIPQIPGLKIEPILQLQPDLVLVSRLSDGNTVAQLRQCDMPVFCFGRFDSLTEIRDNVLLLGKIVDAEERAKDIANWMDHTLTEIKKRTEDVINRPRVLYYNNGFTAGRHTIFDEMVQLARGRNLAAEAGITGHKMMSTELILALDPDVLIVPVPFPDSSSQDNKPTSTMFTQPIWRSVRAVRDGRVHVLPAQHLNSLSHHIVYGAAEVAHVLHPARIPHNLPLVGRPDFLK